MTDSAQYSWWPIYRDALGETDPEKGEDKLTMAEEVTLLRMLDPDVSIVERSALGDALTRLKQRRQELRKTR
jgi:hypothetical protein